MLLPSLHLLNKGVFNLNRTVSDLILEQLAAYGVTHIFGVIGDAIFPLADALARQNKIRFVSASIETGAAFMAAAYAQIEGRLRCLHWHLRSWRRESGQWGRRRLSGRHALTLPDWSGSHN